MNFEVFQKNVRASMEEFCTEVYLQNHEKIRIKKEKTAVKNMEKIFDAVFRITSEKGFQALTMRDLGQETGLSMGALYRYFSNKEELLSMIQAQGSLMIKRVISENTAKGESPLEKLRLAIKAHLFLSEIARPWFVFTFMEARNLSRENFQKVREMETHTEDILLDILMEGEEKNVFRRGDHRLTASLIKAMQQDWYLKRWKYSGRDVSVDDYADHVTEMVEAFCMRR